MTHFESYAQFNDQLLGFIMKGQGDSNAADIVRDQMDEHWKQMSLTEQELMRKRNESPL
jgi:hypothetical protein